MTIGMLVESMVSKAGALQGRFVDASPFQSSDGIETDPIRDFGAALEKAGFARHGGEIPACMEKICAQPVRHRQILLEIPKSFVLARLDQQHAIFQKLRAHQPRGCPLADASISHSESLACCTWRVGPHTAHLSVQLLH